MSSCLYHVIDPGNCVFLLDHDIILSAMGWGGNKYYLTITIHLSHII